MIRSTLFVLPILVFAACSPQRSADAFLDASGADQAFSTPLTDGETDAVLSLVNNATFSELDDEIGLDRRAAQGIVDLRPFADLASLDAVPYVGESALAKLLDHVGDLDDPVELVHGIEEGSDLAEDILLLVNHADEATLDDDVGLDSRAAHNIVTDRLFHTLQELDVVPYVGPSAFADLVDYVLANPPGDIDFDGDGFPASEDCDDTDARVHPAAQELCDGRDTDCDPTTSEDGLVSTATYNTSLSNAGAHDEVFVCPGTYEGDFDFGTDHARITGIGPREDIVIVSRLEGKAYGTYSEARLELTNLTVDGATVAIQDGLLVLDGVDVIGQYGQVVAWFGGRIEATDCRIEGKQSKGMWVYYEATADIDNCSFLNNGVGLTVNGEEAIVENSSFLGNDTGLVVEAWSGARAAFLGHANDFGVGSNDNTEDAYVRYSGASEASYTDLVHDENVDCRANYSHYWNAQARCL